MPQVLITITVALYGGLALLLLSLNIASLWKWWVKGTAIVVTVGGVAVTGPEHGPAIRSAFASRKAALVEAWVDADENPVKPDELTA